jgi:hypothetical protein
LTCVTGFVLTQQNAILIIVSNKISCPKTMDAKQSGRFDINWSRAILSRTAAREIFAVKSNLGLESANQVSIRLAAKYRISPKAIRDIWKGRSWLDATFDLWNEVDRPPRRIVGRPKGKKDSKPRIKGQTRAEQEAHGTFSQYAASTSRPQSMAACDHFDDCSFTTQSNAKVESWPPTESCSSGKKCPWSMVSSEDRVACLLPSFGSLMQGIGLVSAIHDPANHNPSAHPAASQPPSLPVRFPKESRPFPTPSMVGSTGVHNCLPALVTSHLLSSRSALAASAVPVGLCTGLSST